MAVEEGSCAHLECERDQSLKTPEDPPPRLEGGRGTLPSPRFHSVKLSCGTLLSTIAALQRHSTVLSLCLSDDTLNLKVKI